jgi:hypothetical protein
MCWSCKTARWTQSIWKTRILYCLLHDQVRWLKERLWKDLLCWMCWMWTKGRSFSHPPVLSPGVDSSSFWRGTPELFFLSHAWFGFIVDVVSLSHPRLKQGERLWLPAPVVQEWEPCDQTLVPKLFLNALWANHFSEPQFPHLKAKG